MRSIVFRKIRGRIIPIVTAAVAGTTVGSAVASASNKGFHEEIKKARKKNLVDARKFTKKSGINAEIVSTEKGFKKHFGAISRLVNRSSFEAAKKGKNAFTTYKDGKVLILAGSKVNRDVLSHELGHAKGILKRGGMPKYSAFFGSQYKEEVSAWKNAPTKAKNRKLRKEALKTYERQRDYSRVGAAGGVTAYALIALRKKFGL